MVVCGDGGVFAVDFLAGVVRIERPTVLPCERLRGVLPHDLRASNGLTLGECVAVANVENERCWLAHWLDADEVVSDELWIALADERECKSREVGDVCCGCLVFEQHGAVFWIPGVVLVFQDCCHEAEFLWCHFSAFFENR